MKNSNQLLTIVCAMLISVASFAQDVEIRKLDKFTEIKVSEGIELIAKKGTENSVEIRASRIDLEDVYTDQRGDVLKLHRRDGRYRNARIKMELTYTDDLDWITVNTGASAVFEDRMSADRMRVSTSTSGFVELNVDADVLDMSSTTSGVIVIEGMAKEIEATASTGGQIKAFDLNADDVYAKANTGADVRVSANERIKGSANTGGTVRYKGSPRADIRTSTGGSIRKSR